MNWGFPVDRECGRRLSFQPLTEVALYAQMNDALAHLVLPIQITNNTISEMKSICGVGIIK